MTNSTKTKTAFKTSDVAKICHVTGETVKKWLEEGKIKGYRVGTAGHWRILPKDLALFLKNYNIPFPEPEEIGIDLEAFINGRNSPTFCWEFYRKKKNDHVHPERSCEDCLIYRVKCINCYALRDEVGHKKIHCIHSCEDCAYFRYQEREILPEM